jgi:putative transposase
MIVPVAPGYRRLRAGRRSISGQLYLLTTVTRERTPHFADPAFAQLATETISDTETWLPSRCLCWVLMPDHWHGLVELADESLSTAMQRIKGVTSRRLNRHRALEGPLWARGFHDHALRRDEIVEEVVHYILTNPLRAGLVQDLRDYPYWGGPWASIAADPEPQERRD